MATTYLNALLILALAVASNGQTDQCSIKIEFPPPNGPVVQGEAIRGRASIPVSTELRLFRKRHGAQTWMPVSGKIVCQGTPCSWSKRVDYGVSDTRTVDIAVVAVDKKEGSWDGGTLELPQAGKGCVAEVTVTVRR